MPKFNNVMVDIETLGKRTNACLIQVAAVAFDIETGERSHTFNGLIRNSDGALDVDTVAWWMQQAHAPVLGAKLQDASQAGDEAAVLDEFCRFMRLCGEVERVWAHGGTGFDFPILQSAFERCGLAVPWHYRAPRDTRSLFDVAPGGMPRPPKSETRAHDAQYDCEYQVAQVCEAARRIRESYNEAFQGLERTAPMFADSGDRGIPAEVRERADRLGPVVNGETGERALHRRSIAVKVDASEIAESIADAHSMLEEAGIRESALLSEVERWKEEYRVTEAARASFEQAFYKADDRCEKLELALGQGPRGPRGVTGEPLHPTSPYPFPSQEALNAYAEYERGPLPISAKADTAREVEEGCGGIGSL